METNIKGLKISYSVLGEGEAVVLLHGWGANRTLYDGMVNLISKSYKTYAIDFPGFGESPEPDKAMDVGEFKDIIVEFIKNEGIDKVILIGHSFGGRVIFKMFEDEKLPFEIDKIILIDSAGVKPKKTLKQKVKQRIYKISKWVLLTKPVSKLFPDALENLRRKNGSADYNAASLIMRQCLVKTVNEDLTHLFERVTAPTLIIWGSHDFDTPISDAKLMEEKIPDAGLVVLEGAGHFSFLEQPARCHRVIASFLGIN